MEKAEDSPAAAAGNDDDFEADCHATTNWSELIPPVGVSGGSANLARERIGPFAVTGGNRVVSAKPDSHRFRSRTGDEDEPAPASSQQVDMLQFEKFVVSTPSTIPWRQ